MPKNYTEQKRKPGRPTLYCPELTSPILERIAGGETLNRICAEPDMPAAFSVRRWVLQHKEFATLYKQARELQLDYFADLIVDESFDDSRDRNGEGKPDNAAVARSKLKADSLKWLLSKLQPYVYGDKLTTEARITVDDVTTLSPVERAQRIAAILEQARKAKEGEGDSKLH